MHSLPAKIQQVKAFRKSLNVRSKPIANFSIEHLPYIAPDERAFYLSLEIFDCPVLPIILNTITSAQLFVTKHQAHLMNMCETHRKFKRGACTSCRSCILCTAPSFCTGLHKTVNQRRTSRNAVQLEQLLPESLKLPRGSNDRCILLNLLCYSLGISFASTEIPSTGFTSHSLSNSTRSRSRAKSVMKKTIPICNM